MGGLGLTTERVVRRGNQPSEQVKYPSLLAWYYKLDEWWKVYEPHSSLFQAAINDK
jgi:hypothetical protein